MDNFGTAIPFLVAFIGGTGVGSSISESLEPLSLEELLEESLKIPTSPLSVATAAGNNGTGGGGGREAEGDGAGAGAESISSKPIIGRLLKVL